MIRITTRGSREANVQASQSYHIPHYGVKPDSTFLLSSDPMPGCQPTQITSKHICEHGREMSVSRRPSSLQVQGPEKLSDNLRWEDKRVSQVTLDAQSQEASPAAQHLLTHYTVMPLVAEQLIPVRLGSEHKLWITGDSFSLPGTLLLHW